MPAPPMPMSARPTPMSARPMPMPTPLPEVSKVLFGSQDAERAWEPAPDGVFPPVAVHLSAAVLASADELLVLEGRSGDEVLCNRRPPAALLRRLRALGCAAEVTEVPGDPDTAVEHRLAAGALPPGHARGRAPAPYAVVPFTAEAARALGAVGETVPAAVAARVNGKAWSNDFCRTRHLAGVAAAVRTAPELAAAASAIEGPLVLKSPYGVAGRGASVIRDRRQLASFARRLSQRRDQDTAGLLVQPYYRRVLDFSAHLDVGRDGRVGVVGFRGMTNRGLAFASSDTLAPEERRRLADDGRYRAVLTDLGTALAAAGYHGPVSVDGLLTDDGLLVPVLDVNARHSMGRYGLSLERLCADRCRVVGLYTAGVRVGVPYEQAYELISDALAHQGLLWEGTGPGATCLTAGTLQQPSGRLYFAAHADSAREAGEVAAAVRGVLGAGAPPWAGSAG
ncbi:hypothetical protein ACIQM4_04585 [Streptomyces sp. NPDC091272]|uniref:hypothetical protein n=1 Tax=Streptomyces sp. NPDC091272 TaxID=3365981 RepID=UPI0037F84AED